MSRRFAEPDGAFHALARSLDEVRFLCAFATVRPDTAGTFCDSLRHGSSPGNRPGGEAFQRWAVKVCHAAKKAK
jgi:hypothetical protein